MDHEEVNRRIKAEFGYNPLTTKGRIKYLWENHLSRELLAGLISATICLYSFILPIQKQSQSVLEQKIEIKKIQEMEPHKFNPHPYPLSNNPHHFYPKREGEVLIENGKNVLYNFNNRQSNLTKR